VLFWSIIGTVGKRRVDLRGWIAGGAMGRTRLFHRKIGGPMESNSSFYSSFFAWFSETYKYGMIFAFATYSTS
jgi:hypothetical protein